MTTATLQIHNTDDLIVMETKKQAIAILAFSLSKVVKKPQNNLSKRIFNFLDSLQVPYTIQITKSSTRLFLFFLESEVGSVVEKVSHFLRKMEKIGSLDPNLLMSPLNYSNLAQQIKFYNQTSIKKTQDSRITQIGERFWVFTLMTFTKFDEKYFSYYLKDILNLPFSKVIISSKIKKRKNKKNLKPIKAIMLSHNFTSYEEALRFLTEIFKISLHYKQKLSFSLRFFPSKNVKKKKLEILFGLLQTSNQSNYSLVKNLHIERFIPLVIPKKRESQKSTTQMPEKTLLEPIFPYGKPLSNDELKKLVKSIPVPPP
ncbi:MAG: hypothetical protein ACTSX6_03135 [Candidatus Heimdallarchaeaceae archaeon]